MVIDYRLTDIVAERFDAGIRSGEQVEKDMVAVRVRPDLLKSSAIGCGSAFCVAQNWDCPNLSGRLTILPESDAEFAASNALKSLLQNRQ